MHVDRARRIIGNQLGRRNLSEQQKEYLRGRRYWAEKSAAMGRPKKSGQSDSTIETDATDRLAEEYDVSPATMKRGGRSKQSPASASAGLWFRIHG